MLVATGKLSTLLLARVSGLIMVAVLIEALTHQAIVFPWYSKKD